MFTSDDLKEMTDELNDMEREATASRTLVREFRTTLSQPVFAEVENLAQLRRLIIDGSADNYGVVRENADTLIALVDKGREEGLTLSQFKDTLFHLFRLTEMQVIFARGAKEFFTSPATTEVSQMSSNTIVSEMSDILMNKDDEAGD